MLEILAKIVLLIVYSYVLTGFSALLDPCERGQVDSISYLSLESRELITYTAQVGIM